MVLNAVCDGMSRKPLVSVIMCFFNREKFIEEAIESVFAQTYNNWELLLVDDGSSDTSVEIARGYAEQYPGKVHYLEHENHRNRGASVSRNLGIRNAKGEYITFLDSDDVWLPEVLERHVAILESHPEAGMVYGPVQFWYGWTGNAEDTQRDFVQGLGVQPNTLVKPPTLFKLCYPIGEAASPSTCNLMVRYALIERIGGFEESFDVQLKYQLYEDQTFFTKVYLSAPVFILGESLAKYRQHPDSTVHLIRASVKYHSARLFFLNWLELYLSKQEVKDVEVWQALRKTLRPYRHPTLYRLERNARHLAERIKGSLNTMKRLVQLRSTGAINANPNPVLVSNDIYGLTTLSWTSKGTETVEVRVDAPDGPLFSLAGPFGNAIHDWVTDGKVFYLQDVSGGLPLVAANTLATVTVYVIPAEDPLS